MSNSISPKRKSSLLASLIFIIVLVLIYHFFLEKFLSFPCQPLWISYATFVLVVEVLFQASWKRLSVGLDRSNEATIELPLIKFSVKLSVLVEMFDSIYLNLPVSICLIAIFVSVFALALALLVPSVKEAPPVVLEFRIQSLAQPLLPGEAALITGPTFISATIDGEYALPCQWQTIKGSAAVREDCSTIYTPPRDGAEDALTVVVSSTCKTARTHATIFLNSAK